MLSSMYKSLILLTFLVIATFSQKSFSYESTFDFSYRPSPLISESFVKESTVKSGQGLYQALRDVGIENELALEMINNLRDEVEFSKLKVGDNLSAEYDYYNHLKRFTFSKNPAEKHIVERKDGAWVYSFKEEETQWFSRMITGELSIGSTLQGELLDMGVNPEVANEIISALMCKVNFRMHARIGDQFKALIQERMFEDQVIETKVLYTAYDGKIAGLHESFYYEDSEKASTYNAHYTEEGQALIRSGLRYPLSRLHIRSGYGWRRHPVTGRRTMHRGIDLRGRVGKAVHAVAAGKVVESTYNKYAGNKIAIRHRDGSKSYYMHLNKRGVNKGEWVRSNQVIGTVGSTGRVTGPHLHFGFKKANGRWMNPLNKRMIATPKLRDEKLLALKAQVQKTRELIQDLAISDKVKYLLAKIPNRYPASVDESSELILTLNQIFKDSN